MANYLWKTLRVISPSQKLFLQTCEKEVAAGDLKRCLGLASEVDCGFTGADVQVYMHKGKVNADFSSIEAEKVAHSGEVLLNVIMGDHGMGIFYYLVIGFHYGESNG